MRIEKIIKLNVELDNAERIALDEVAKVLRRIEEAMEKYECDTLMCCDEYTYDVSDVRDVIDTLERFENITEIFA